MTTDYAPTAEVFRDGLDFGFECVCDRVRGLASRDEAQAAADVHECEER